MNTKLKISQTRVFSIPLIPVGMNFPILPNYFSFFPRPKPLSNKPLKSIVSRFWVKRSASKKLKAFSPNIFRKLSSEFSRKVQNPLKAETPKKECVELWALVKDRFKTNTKSK